jgi:hypothetical protein
VIEPVTGKLLMRNLEGAAAVYWSPLDGGGRPVGTPIRAQKTAGGWEVKLGEAVTTWYEVTVQR